VLNTDYLDVRGEIGQARTVFTGPIDEYFSHCFGGLPYRSLDFRHEQVNVEYAQPVAVVNYPNEGGFTRILEHKHLTADIGPTTVLTTEWPLDHVTGVTDPYYPIPREENRALHARYLELAADTVPEVVFAGRLADYKYYNMDQAVSRALLAFRGLAPTVVRSSHMSGTST
jgi:UDP-galactopyranose mutase